MATAKQTKKKKSVKEHAVSISKNVFFGNILSSAFFNRHKFSILLIIFMFMFYISYKYECQTSMEKITKLEKELSIVKSESVRQRSTYRSRTRESMMQHRIDSLGLGLTVQQQPPFVLYYDK